MQLVEVGVPSHHLPLLLATAHVHAEHRHDRRDRQPRLVLQLVLGRDYPRGDRLLGRHHSLIAANPPRPVHLLALPRRSRFQQVGRQHAWPRRRGVRRAALREGVHRLELAVADDLVLRKRKRRGRREWCGRPARRAAAHAGAAAGEPVAATHDVAACVRARPAPPRRWCFWQSGRFRAKTEYLFLSPRPRPSFGWHRIRPATPPHQDVPRPAPAPGSSTRPASFANLLRPPPHVASLPATAPWPPPGCTPRPPRIFPPTPLARCALPPLPPPTAPNPL